MKTLDIPKSGKCGLIVAYVGPFGSCERAFVVPANTKSPARNQRRREFGSLARAWGGVLTEPQRDRWSYAAGQVMSHPRLGQQGPLTGQQHFQSINTARACIGREPLWEPPAPVAFGLNPVGQLIITNGEDGVRLLLSVSGPVTEDLMVFGQAPCSAGRMKRRRVVYLGLLPVPVGGLSDITEQYVARFGEPRPGQKVFIVTRQQKDGWEWHEKETNEIVPGNPAGQPERPRRVGDGRSEGAEGGVLGGANIAQTENSQKPHMYNGCTTGAQGSGAGVEPGLQGGGEGGIQGGNAAKAASDGGEGGAGMLAPQVRAAFLAEWREKQARALSP